MMKKQRPRAIGLAMHRFWVEEVNESALGKTRPYAKHKQAQAPRGI
jgi:hypothetical protein